MKFKITGPSKDGKSTTLLYLSRSYFNIVYLNLETINILYQNKKIKKVLEILIYEFGRIEFTNEEDKRYLKKNLMNLLIRYHGD